MVSGDDDLGAAAGCVPDRSGEVRHRGHAGLVQEKQRTGADVRRAACLGLAGQVAEELSGVLGERDACFSHSLLGNVSLADVAASRSLRAICATFQPRDWRS